MNFFERPAHRSAKPETSPRRHGLNIALISVGVILPAVIVTTLFSAPKPATSSTAIDTQSAIIAQDEITAQSLPISTGADIRSYLLQNPDVIVEVLTLLNDRADEAARVAKLEAVQMNRAALHNDNRSHVGGNPNGSVTVVEFVDFKCGYCRKAHNEIKAMVAANPDVRLIVKQYPILGPESLLAAKAAQGVQDLFGAEAYALFADALMTFEGPLNTETVTRIFKEIGFKKEAFARVTAQMDSPEMGALLSYTRELASELEIKGTPAFVINDEVVAGYITPERMIAVLDRTRARLLAQKEE